MKGFSKRTPLWRVFNRIGEFGYRRNLRLFVKIAAMVMRRK